MKTIGISVLFVLAIGCGGGDGGAEHSGVDLTKSATALDTAEVETFCDWLIDVNGGESVVTTCPDDVTVTSPTHAECLAEYAQIPDSCSGLTVEDLENCARALAEDPCSFGGQACAAYFECAFQA